MKYIDFIKSVQSAMNAHGEHLGIDGDPGVLTQAALEKYDVQISVSKPEVVAAPPIAIGDHFRASWIFANLDLLGLSETDSQLNARYVPEWALEGLSEYKNLAGNDHAWCSLRANADRRKVGVKGTNSADAASWSGWGKKCPFWFGAALDIEHKTGGRHVADFLYWIDKENRIAATLNGNLGNLFCIAKTDLSGSGDRLVTGPRWSNDVADGIEVSMSDALAQYPFLKVGSQRSSTR